jgi:hypothetical protein
LAGGAFGWTSTNVRLAKFYFHMLDFGLCQPPHPGCLVSPRRHRRATDWRANRIRSALADCTCEQPLKLDLWQLRKHPGMSIKSSIAGAFTNFKWRFNRRFGLFNMTDAPQRTAANLKPKQYQRLKLAGQAAR